MVVRFLPPPEEHSKPQPEDRGDLAEVIEFRSKLRRPSPIEGSAAERPARPAPVIEEPPRRATEPVDGLSAWVNSSDDSWGDVEQDGGYDALDDGAYDGTADSVDSWRDDREPAPRAVAVASPPKHDEPAAASEQTAAPAQSAPKQPEPKQSASERAKHSWARLIETSPVAEQAGAKVTKVRFGEASASAVADDEGDTPSDEPEGPSAYETAVKLLARKPLSSGELQRALVVAGHPEFDAQDAVAQCLESLYLDDDALAESVAQKLRDSKGESKARIRQKLRERHLPDTAIDAALENLDDDAEFELLRQTAQDRARRMAGLDRPTAERRLLGFLARRGWSGERATKAVREALDGSASGGSRGRGSVRFQ